MVGNLGIWNNIALVGRWKCYLRKTTLNNPKKTRLSLCYVKKKLYFCTRKIKAKRVRGSKNRQKRDFDVKNQLKKINDRRNTDF